MKRLSSAVLGVVALAALAPAGLALQAHAQAAPAAQANTSATFAEEAAAVRAIAAGGMSNVQVGAQ